jgi:acetyl/propionyl-CoA carboxylase alpha subunit
MRALHEEGITAVGVYETPDHEARHIRVADEAVWIGDGPREDYLNIEKIIWAAKKSGCQAIHPCYGFLAENPDFARACNDEGIVFIGPTENLIRDFGNKIIARRNMKQMGILCVPGTDSLPKGKEVPIAKEFIKKYGLPVMIKAAAGGGGRGIRKVDSEDGLIAQIQLARQEAQSTFNDDSIYLEKCLSNPKHIEVQILGDSHGNVIHLGTRNCSIQRRHQKLIELAPSLLPADKEQQICQAALKAGKEIGYINSGTVEFLVDENNNYFFLELNTRLQVEHTVTEMVTDIDIVRQQIRIAEGLPLDIRQEDVSVHGYAIELRINAEDPQNDFFPEVGKTVIAYESPGGPGVRLDGFVYQGFTIPNEYDSLLVKLSVHGFSWPETINRMRRALRDFVIVGPRTTIPFYLNISSEPDFQSGKFDTGYLDSHPELFEYRVLDREELKIARLLAEIHHHGYNPFAI